MLEEVDEVDSRGWFLIDVLRMRHVGYLNNPEATASTLDKDHWLHTGDLVYIDNDGYIYIMDRLKELIKYKALQVLKSLRRNIWPSYMLKKMSVLLGTRENVFQSSLHACFQEDMTQCLKELMNKLHYGKCFEGCSSGARSVALDSSGGRRCGRGSVSSCFDYRCLWAMDNSVLICIHVFIKFTWWNCWGSAIGLCCSSKGEFITRERRDWVHSSSGICIDI